MPNDLTFTKIGEGIGERERARCGYCVGCRKNPKFVHLSDPYPLCPECIASATEGVEEESPEVLDGG